MGSSPEVINRKSGLDERSTGRREYLETFATGREERNKAASLQATTWKKHSVTDNPTSTNRRPKPRFLLSHNLSCGIESKKLHQPDAISSSRNLLGAGEGSLSEQTKQKPNSGGRNIAKLFLEE